jgi:phage gpG-like protein
MSISIRITQDSITPKLRKLARTPAIRRQVLEAMGTQLVSLTKRAFNDASLRAAAWSAHKKPQCNQLLKKSGALFQSIRIARMTDDAVTVASDRRYAAVHQLGSARAKGRGGGIPARPFFPFTGGQMTQIAQGRVQATARRKLDALLRA